MKDIFAKDRDGMICSTGEALVAYLYGELKADEAVVIEDHLSVCDTCTREFADLSFARLDVFEWNRDEFAAIETPRIKVPLHGHGRSSSWLAAVQAFVASPVRWAVPAAGFAVMAVAFGIWLGSAGPVDVAGRNSNVVSQPSTAGPSLTPGTLQDVVSATSTEPKPLKRPVDSAVSAPRVVRTVARSAARPAPTATAERRTEIRTTVKTKTAPRLNDFDDEDDTTLRLGDLLADIDTRDE